MAYIGKSPTGTGVRSRFYYTASGSETSLSGTDDAGLTLTFSDGNFVDVSLNGVALVAGTDYNTNTANTISGLSALSASDIVEVVVYDIFTVADTVSAKDGGTFSGNMAMGGTLSVTGASTATGGLNVGTIKEATGTTTAITIDSSGQVLLSAIPYMRMTCTDGTSFLKSSVGTVRYNNIIASRGITLNGSTFKFQVPVAGLYHFSGAVRWNNASSYLWWRVSDDSGDVSNGALVLNNGNSTSFITSAGSLVVPLATSTDYQIAFGDGASNTASLDISGQTFMAIYLVGAS